MGIWPFRLRIHKIGVLLGLPCPAHGRSDAVWDVLSRAAYHWVLEGSLAGFSGAPEAPRAPLPRNRRIFWELEAEAAKYPRSFINK